MRKDISLAVMDAIRAIEFLKKDGSIDFIYETAKMIAAAFDKGNKIVIAGNGGSLCDAMHFAEELTGYFRKKRKALPAIALCEPGHLTCVSNDEGYDYVFSRAAEAYLQKGDIFISLTTSGNSKNLLNAIKAAKQKEAKTITFLGKTGGIMKGLSDLEIIIEGFTTSDRIQEAHMAMIHIIIEIIEKILFAPRKILEKLKHKQPLKIS